MQQIIALALAAIFAANVAAQQAARPDPADPKAPVAAYRYESAFQDYRRYADPELARWREVNEEVSRLGGHMRHAPQPAQKGKPAPKSAAQPAHGGHK